MALTIDQVRRQYLQPAAKLDLSGAVLGVPTLAGLLQTYFGADRLPLTAVTPVGSSLVLTATTVLPAAGGAAGANLPVTITFVADDSGVTLAEVDVSIGPAASLTTRVWTLPATLVSSLAGATLTLRLNAGAAGSELVALAIPLVGAAPLPLLLDAALLHDGGDDRLGFVWEAGATPPTLSQDLHELAYFNGAATFVSLLPGFGTLLSAFALERLEVVGSRAGAFVSASAGVKLVDVSTIGPFSVGPVSGTFTILAGKAGGTVSATFGGTMTYGSWTADATIDTTGAFTLPITSGVTVDALMSAANAGSAQQLSGVQGDALEITGTLPARGSTAPFPFTLKLAIEKSIDFLDDIVYLDGAVITIDHTATMTTASLAATVTLGATLAATASYDATAGWKVDAHVVFEPGKPLELSAVIGDLTGRFGVQLPWSESAVDLDTFSFSCAGGTTIAFALGAVLALGSSSRIDAALTLTKASGKYTPAISGTVTVDGTVLALEAAQGQSVDLALEDASGVTLSTVAGWLGIAISPSVGPSVHTIALHHDLAGGGNGFSVTTDRITALGASDGTHRLVTIAVHLGLTFAYSGLSLPGLSVDLDFGVTDVDLVIANADIDAATLTALGRLLPPKTTFSATAPMSQGRVISASLLLGTEKKTLSFDAGGGEQQQREHFAASAATSPTTASMTVQKQIGPVHVDRLGVGYADGVVTLSIFAGFTLAALKLDFEGLQLHATFSDGITGFDLNGLALSMQGQAFTIAGEFLEEHDPAYDGGRAFSGAAVLTAETLTIAAAGGWGSVNGDPSLFVFGQFDKPLGGPPFFFVRGISAAFGLNRSLIVPPVDQLTTFPLVQAAMADANNPNPLANKSPIDVLTSLEGVIKPDYGQNWAAAGVRFTSFGVIEGFALLIVRFGGGVTFQLIGVGATSLPKGAEHPLAYAEIPVEVTVDPSAGSVVALARLAPSSFVLDPACHLTGGFAFAAWFKDDASTGATAGDFVYTIGGYHPAFNAPKHYPSVPRLSAIWQSGNLTIDGTYYFAITPSALMAGGSLQAVWQDGGLRAWFDVEADFLISWRPFAYDAFVGINLGASFTIDLLITSIDVTIHIGVDLHFWGPPFQGEASIDLDIISFTVSFGASGDSSEQQPIPWSDFKAGFFPPPTNDPPAALQMLRALADVGAPAPATVDVALCRARVTKGLLSTQTPDSGDPLSPDWIVDGVAFELTTESSIPATAAYLITGDTPTSTPLTGTWSTTTFGVGPVGVPNGQLLSEHTISLRGLGEAPHDPTPALTVTPVIGAVPGTAWSTALAQKPSTSTINANPATIANTLLGFKLAPNTGPSDEGLPQPISLLRLEFANDPHVLHWAWTTPTVPPSTTHPQAQAVARVTATIEDPAVVARRETLIAAAQAAGLTVTSGAQLSGMAQTFTNAAAPLLRALGEL
jgi:hypothetical protein